MAACEERPFAAWLVIIQRPVREAPVFQFRLPSAFQRKKSVTSAEIDDELYGGR